MTILGGDNMKVWLCSYEDYKKILWKISNGNIGIEDECGKYFYTVSEEVGDTSNEEVYSMIGKELKEVVIDVIIDTYNEKVAILCKAINE